jgi:hypothetical protein
MRLRKTDRRFKLYQYGFDCYVEFNSDEWNNYNRTVRYCRENLGPEFWEFSSRVYENGNWKSYPHHRNKVWSSKRVYFRGEKYHTLLLMAIPLEDKNTFYL